MGDVANFFSYVQCCLIMEIPKKDFPILSEIGIFHKNKVTRGVGLWCFNGRTIVGGRPYPKFRENYKTPCPRFDFICIKFY